MNINLRALVFGTVIAAALTATIDVVAAERHASLRPVAQRDAGEALEVIRLEPIVVTAHKDAA